MIDRDLADLYDVPTKVLKQAVKRHLNRFPNDFMFEMTKEEFNYWRSQFVTSNADRMGLRYEPYCFTEMGVAMLSSILNSERAIETNIQIIRTFTHMRQLMMNHAELYIEIEKIKTRLDNQDKNMEIVFRYLDELLENTAKPRSRNQIGYRSFDQSESSHQ